MGFMGKLIKTQRVSDTMKFRIVEHSALIANFVTQLCTRDNKKSVWTGWRSASFHSTQEFAQKRIDSYNTNKHPDNPF